MRNNTNNQQFNNLLKVGKRIAITMLVCVPFLILFGYFTRNVITQNWLQIIIFIVVMGVAVLIEEIIARKREKKKTEVTKDYDVFK